MHLFLLPVKFHKQVKTENTYIAYHSRKKMQGGGLNNLAGSVRQNHFFQSKYLKNGCNVLKYGRYFVYSIFWHLGKAIRPDCFHITRGLPKR